MLKYGDIKFILFVVRHPVNIRVLLSVLSTRLAFKPNILTLPGLFNVHCVAQLTFKYLQIYNQRLQQPASATCRFVKGVYGFENIRQQNLYCTGFSIVCTYQLILNLRLCVEMPSKLNLELYF